MERKLYMTFEIDESAMQRVLKSRKNPIARAEWVKVQCKYCDSLDVFRFGYDRKGKQRFVCNVCRRTFMDNKAPPHKQFPIEAIALALNLFYESASLAKIQRQLNLTFGVRPDRMTIYRWVMAYSKKAVDAISKVPVEVGSDWVADETVVSLKMEKDKKPVKRLKDSKDKKERGEGSKVWFWDVVDQETRFLLGSRLTEGRFTKDAKAVMEQAAIRANKAPDKVVTDKLAAYLDGIELAFGADTKHIKAETLTSEPAKQLVERFHGTIKDRVKVLRSFLRKGTAKLVLDGWQVHYNFFRPHTALKGKTPAEAAKAKAPYQNWADVVKEKLDTNGKGNTPKKL